MEEMTYKYLIQDPEKWIEFGINIGGSILALALYVVIKVYSVAKEMDYKLFIKKNFPFWRWHFLATVVIAFINFLFPNAIEPLLSFFGIDLGAEGSFLMVGAALALSAYGENKKDLNDFIATEKWKKDKGFDPNKELINKEE